MIISIIHQSNNDIIPRNNWQFQPLKVRRSISQLFHKEVIKNIQTTFKNETAGKSFRKFNGIVINPNFCIQFEENELHN